MFYLAGYATRPTSPLTPRLAQEKHKHVEIKCWSCNSSLTFGQKQEDPDTFYLRKKEDKTFDWKAFTPMAAVPIGTAAKGTVPSKVGASNL